MVYSIYEKKTKINQRTIEAQHQEYEALIADSLAKIEQQLRESGEAMQDTELDS